MYGGILWATMDTPAQNQSEDPFDRFLQESIEVDAMVELDEQFAHDTATELFHQSAAMIGYELPVAGTKRYETERQKIHAEMIAALEIDMQTHPYSPEFEVQMRAMIADDVERKVKAKFFAEILAADMTIATIREIFILGQEVDLEDEEITTAKRQLLAYVIKALPVPEDAPIINVIMLAMQGDPVDLSDESMTPHYERAQLQADKSHEVSLRIAAIQREEFKIAMRSTEVSQEDLLQIEYIAWDFADAVRVVFADNDLSLDARREKLNNMANVSPLGFKTAWELIEFAKRNKKS